MLLVYPNPVVGKVCRIQCRGCGDHLALTVQPIDGTSPTRVPVHGPDAVVDYAFDRSGTYVLRASDGVRTVSKRVLVHP